MKTAHVQQPNLPRNLNRGPTISQGKAPRTVESCGPKRLKPVVCRSPPNLPEHIFWQFGQAWVIDEAVVGEVFCPGNVDYQKK